MRTARLKEEGKDYFHCMTRIVDRKYGMCKICTYHSIRCYYSVRGNIASTSVEL